MRPVHLVITRHLTAFTPLTGEVCPSERFEILEI
jgi:hypothetical protein